MNLTASAVTAIVTLVGVALGGWLTLRNQDRLWRRDHARQWRDIRLSAYTEFLSAYRQYIAYVLDPNAHILTEPHPHRSDELMPFFDEAGRPYKEKLEAAVMTIRLASEHPDTPETAENVIRSARHIAAARATHSERSIPHHLFHELWQADRQFVVAARRELGLTNIWPAVTAS